MSLTKSLQTILIWAAVITTVIFTRLFLPLCQLLLILIKDSLKQSSPMHTIVATKDHPKAPKIYKDCYCYTDEHVEGEPLVHQTTAVIEKLFEWQDLKAPDAVEISFTAHDPERFDKHNPVLYLHHMEPDEDELGCTYIVDLLHPTKLSDRWLASELEGDDPLTAWLCEHILDYFESPPSHFYAQIKAC